MLVLFSALILVARVRTFSEPYERDIATEILLGRELAAGSRMYVDVVEFKPPGSIVIWQLVHLTIGTSTIAVGLTNVVFSVLTLFGVYWAGRGPRGSRMAGLWAAALWAIVGGERYLQANQPNIEVFMNAGIAWGVALLLTAHVCGATWWRYALAGVLLSFATLQKHHVVLVCVCLGSAWLGWAWRADRNPDVRRKAIVGIAIVAGTICLTWALVAGYFAIRGRFDYLIDGVVRYATHYAGTRGGSTNDDAGRVGIAGNLLEGLKPWRLLPDIMLFAVPLWIVSAIGVTGALRVPATRRAGLLMLGWFVGTFLVISLPGTFFRHYYQLWLPVLAVAGGWGMMELCKILRSPKRVLPAAIMVLAPICAWVVPEYFDSPDKWSIKKYGPTFVHTRDVALELKHLLRPEETFYLWGIDPGLYYYAERRPASGILWVHQLVYGPFQDRWSEHVLNDLKRIQPVLFIAELPVEGYEDHPILVWAGQNYIPARRFQQGSEFLPYVLKGSRLEKMLARPVDSDGPDETVPALRSLLRERM